MYSNNAHDSLMDISQRLGASQTEPRYLKFRSSSVFIVTVVAIAIFTVGKPAHDLNLISQLMIEQDVFLFGLVRLWISSHEFIIRYVVAGGTLTVFLDCAGSTTGVS